MTQIYNKLELRSRRKNLRNNQTKAEQILWQKLKGKGFHNLKFRIQVSFGYYIVDFFCKEKNLVIELDGDTHATTMAVLYDEQRSVFLERLGFKVLRFSNEEIYNNLDNVLEVLGSRML